MDITFILIGGAVTAAGAVIAIILNYRRQINDLRESFMKLSQSFEELDDQAKLIVKTDLELNKTQEELDRRVRSLDSLQKLSRGINTTLDEHEIFNRLSYDLLNELGFERYLFLLLPDNVNFKNMVAFGFNEQSVDTLNNFFGQNPDLIKSLKSGAIISSVNLASEIKSSISEILETEDFVIAPVLVQNLLLGLIVAGHHSPTYFLTDGDAEMISILADQLGQAIENARLFEEVFRARRDLELRIQERTRQFTEALERVKRISKNKSEFISAVSHELRTPLTSIKGYASILIAGKIGEIPETVRDRLEKINKHSDNLVSLINNLLDISRIESGKADLLFKKQPLLQIIETVEDLLGPQLKEKRIVFQKNIPATLPDVVVDGGQIERVLINLVSNAVKFTPFEGVITVSSSWENDYITTCVSDTGIGLKSDDQERLFDEFYRVDNEINQKVKGTGLGLSLVKKIVEAHSGTIWVTSKYGEGANFHFTLPVKETLIQKSRQ
ncbi:MAG: GAF domain-containing sensor histidine kinase [Candidatus Omnitrophota bacterium]